MEIRRCEGYCQNEWDERLHKTNNRSQSWRGERVPYATAAESRRRLHYAGSDSAFSLGMQIQSTTYNSKPKPKASEQKRNPALHIHEGSGVALANPPHTPPIQLSLDDLVTFLRFCNILILRCSTFTLFCEDSHYIPNNRPEWRGDVRSASGQRRLREPSF
jgi:hypothetical protein